MLTNEQKIAWYTEMLTRNWKICDEFTIIVRDCVKYGVLSDGMMGRQSQKQIENGIESDDKWHRDETIRERILEITK